MGQHRLQLGLFASRNRVPPDALEKTPCSQAASTKKIAASAAITIKLPARCLGSMLLSAQVTGASSVSNNPQGMFALHVPNHG